MEFKRKFLILSIFVVLFPLPTNAVSWELYFKTESGFEYYIDKDSVHKTPERTWLVWQQIFCPIISELTLVNEKRTITWDNSKSEILYEIDCSRRRYKVLKEKEYFINGGIHHSDKPEDGWEHFEPTDLDESLYIQICKPELKRLEKNYQEQKKKY